LCGENNDGAGEKSHNFCSISAQFLVNFSAIVVRESSMKPEHYLCFPPFRLDLVNQRLWRDGQEIPLRQKTFAVLRYLVEHPDHLVTKEALLDAVWAETSVSDVAPGVCIQELRRALGEERQTPRFIVTVHRRGYRFIAPLTTPQLVQSSRFKVQSPNQSPAISTQHPAPTLVGRETELSQLHRWLETALEGQRQIVFVTGEPGIGKTTLVNTFLEQIAADEQVWLGRGQCIEHYGAGEAYLPVLEALGRLCREPGGERLIELLAQQAPTWLVQMPALLSAAELEALQRKVLGATQGRMLREMAEAVEALTAERALVLWLEDLQWSDVSTLEWLSALARRRERARLLVIGAYRSVDVIVREHPLKAVKQELQLHGRCEELPLACLTEAAVAEYLAVKFASPPPPLF
jgi:DNA-binding winged helix-turn-helix (wHTH) protein